MDVLCFMWRDPNIDITNRCSALLRDLTDRAISLPICYNQRNRRMKLFCQVEEELSTAARTVYRDTHLRMPRQSR
jgi:hypothetical protein